MGLREFCFGEDGVFIIPAEALLPQGIHPQAADQIVQVRGLSPEWPQRFGQAFNGFLMRWNALAKKAPGRWWPPRLQNVVVIDKPWGVRPFSRPLTAACWVVYAEDFEEHSGSLEFAIYTLLHAERLNSTPDYAAAMLTDLGYWLERSEEEIQDFQQGAERATRPGAEAFRQVAAQLPNVRRCYDDIFRPAPEFAPTEPVAGSTLRAPRGSELKGARLLETLRSLCLADYETIRRTLSEAEGEGPTVSQWLAKERPRLVVTDREQAVLWSPDQGEDTADVSKHLDALPPSIAASFIADLEVLGGITETFFATLPKDVALKVHGDSTEEADGVYLHHELGLLAYSLSQPAGDPTTELQPPYARLLLSARCAHEWGHVAADNGLIKTPQEGIAEARIAAIDHALLPFVKQLPIRIESLVREEGVSADPHEAVVGLRRRLLSRQDDFFSNKVALQLTSDTAMECYFRSNAPCHAEELLGPMAQLLRAAHEYQYLCLAQIRDPWNYYMSTTRFRSLFISSGWVTQEQVKALFSAVSDYFESFEIATRA
jgi:hypothetical protein